MPAKKAIPLAILCTFLWGCAFPCVKVGYELFQISSNDIFSQMLFAGIRFSLAGLVTLIISTYLSKSFPSIHENIASITILGLLQTGLQYALFYYGLAHTSGIRGSILNATSNLMTVIIVGIIWYKQEPLTIKKTIGALIGFLGVIVINGSGVGGESFTFAGEGCVLLSSLCLAISSPLTKVLTRKISPIVIAGWQLFIGGICLFTIGLFGGGKIYLTNIKGVLLIIFMIIISAVAYPIWTYLFKLYSVSKVAVYNFMIPIFGVSLSGVILSEGLLGLRGLFALALVCLGIVLVNTSIDGNTDNSTD